MVPAPSQRIASLRHLTRSLNLHVPPSSFASATVVEPYEQALAPVLEPDAGPMHLYVGVPLCFEHCRFCMYFHGLTDADGRRAEGCLQGLERFLATLGAAGPTRPVAGSYIGGGTPTVLSATQITRLLAAVNTAFRFDGSAQRTFEMSPQTATTPKVRAVVAGGYNRVSFGVQSFDPAVVAATGRTYVTVDAVRRLIDACATAGVAEVNVDLMVGLAGESDDTLADSVADLVRTGCHTISVYRYRPGRRAELVDRGGMDAYVRRCARRVGRAVAVAGGAGWRYSGRLDGEHVRLLASPAGRWPEPNLYETRFRPDLANSLVGIGAASRSFLRNERMVFCPHRPSAGYELVGRPVDVELCDPTARVAAALVNGFFRDHEVDLALIERQCGVAAEDVFAAEFEYLLTEGALVRVGSRCTVHPARRDEWSHLEKLFYPPDWLAARAGTAGGRIR